jgi:threonylcarbamoyladenosine tRNA methylthiotransferase MtaB
MKISIVTLGCKVNQSESASIEGSLRQAGHEIVSSAETPDLTIINTCTVTAKSDYQSRQMIRRAAKSGSRVIATGCYAQLRPDELSTIKGLNLVVGNAGKSKMIEYVNGLYESSGEFSKNVKSPEYILTPQPYFSSRTRAFLKIQDGCNLSCAYCAVPSARGRSRSLDAQHVINSIEELTLKGYKEVVLTGVHIGTYGIDLEQKTSLFNLVDRIVKKFPQIRYRLSSIEPQEFDERFLDLINENLLCPHLHIPLQSGSEKVLKMMKRRYTVSSYRELIDKILSKCPEIAIGTDLIAGFPGESEDDFRETARFIEAIPFSYIHVFPYSKRPNTLASSINGHISEEEKKRRVNTILEIDSTKRKNYIYSQLNKRLDVIIEKKPATNGHYGAISSNYLKLLVEASALRTGERLDVLGIAIRDQKLICRPANNAPCKR